MVESCGIVAFSSTYVEFSELTSEDVPGTNSVVVALLFELDAAEVVVVFLGGVVHPYTSSISPLSQAARRCRGS